MDGPMDKQKMVYRYSEILIDLKQEEILTHVAAWMKCKNMLSEINQPQKNKFFLGMKTS